MPGKLALALRYAAIFLFVIAIALIIVRWKFPQTQARPGNLLGQLREARRQWRKRRSRERERREDQKRLKNRLVLLIDPDEKSARVLVWKLRDLKAQVLRSRTGTRGLDHVRAKNPDVLVVDALLTDMSAADFYNALSRSDLPVIFVGVPDNQRDEFRKLGSNVACVPKPYDPEELAAAAGRMLGRQYDEMERSA